MALYYFDHENDGMMFSDDQGTECQDVAAVRYEAISLADITRGALPDGNFHNLVMMVRDSVVIWCSGQYPLRGGNGALLGFSGGLVADHFSSAITPEKA